MTILAQHGWGKSDKIQRGISSGSIDGVIMSPRDERPQNLAAFLSDLQAEFPDAVRLVDPQFHIGTVSPARIGMLDQYLHFEPSLTLNSCSPAQIRGFVDETLTWQGDLEVSAVISPTVMVSDLRNRWAQVALNLAQETLNQFNGSKPLLIGLVVEEGALRQRAPVDEWLDSLTQMDVDGFYLVVRRESETYRQHYDPDALTSLLHICYSLAELNDYRVFVGYTDMATLLLHALGVTATASGWSLGLRQFTLSRFQPRSGGRPPRSRYSSLPLLNSIYMTELDGLYNAGNVANVLSGTPYDGRFNMATNPENVEWPTNEAALHHWHVLNGISRSLVANSTGGRLDLARNTIAQADAVYTMVSNIVPLTVETGPTHLGDWLNALDTFRSEASV